MKISDWSVKIKFNSNFFPLVRTFLSRNAQHENVIGILLMKFVLNLARWTFFSPTSLYKKNFAILQEWKKLPDRHKLREWVKEEDMAWKIRKNANKKTFQSLNSICLIILSNSVAYSSYHFCVTYICNFIRRLIPCGVNCHPEVTHKNSDEAAFD